jgi:TonB family protein
MIAAAFASVLAVTAIGDTTSLVPGTSLRFGAESGRFGASQGFQPSPRPQPPERLERSGTMRFFGIDAVATLGFQDRRLVQAEFVIERASPRQLSYIEDDLVRRGYRRACDMRQPDRSRCTWTGQTQLELVRERSRITATIRPLPRRPGAGDGLLAGNPMGDGADRDAPGVPADAAPWPMHPDTLELSPGWVDGDDRILTVAPSADYPRAARDSGVQGVVRLLARVDTTGAVDSVVIARSIPELDSAAVAIARGTLFRPFLHEGRRVGAWVRMPVRFTLH